MWAVVPKKSHKPVFKHMGLQSHVRPYVIVCSFIILTNDMKFYPY